MVGMIHLTVYCLERQMTKEQMYLLGFNTALDRVDEHIEELRYLDQCLGVQDIKDITEELRGMVNGKIETMSKMRQ